MKNKENNAHISPAQEDYLETIYILSINGVPARNKDIAEKLGVKRATVTGALRLLAEKKLLYYKPSRPITLTEEGLRCAERIIRHHQVLKSFFLEILELKETEADTIACQVEHFMNDQAFSRLEHLIHHIRECEKPCRFSPSLTSTQD